MAAVRSLRVSVKPDSGSDSDSESDKDAREAEPMEVEDGELEDEVSVSRSLKELLPDTSRRYENKAGSFITGIDVNSKEAIERKEKRAQRFHFRPEDNAEQRDVLMDKETMKKAIPNLRMEALYPAADPETVTTETESSEQPETESKGGEEGSGTRRGGGEEEEGEESSEEIEVKEGEVEEQKKKEDVQVEDLYYMKYGNPNYGGMRGVLSNSWKRRFHTRRIQRDVIKTKKPLIGDNMGHTPPYTHRHSGEEEGDEDMEEDDRVVEYGDRVGERGGASRSLGAGLRGRQSRSPSPWSESDEMDYDLELKMISTPSPKKTKKMTMYADELDTTLKSIRDVRQLLEEKRKGLSPRQPPGGPRRKDRKENASSIRRGGDGEEERRKRRRRRRRRRRGQGRKRGGGRGGRLGAAGGLGAMIKQKQERLTTQIKKSRLDNLPSLQIEISRESSDESDN
ncbi:hypothetical protein F7725_006355 [Dissostichus mawsoni]|uniref:Nuclear cap-binding protein subunit 3 n=1 Tax=Dissostichus mawsoni TaxID=36200 RepID=A0A7J5XUM9_DISMA|nr:hypothetical protein F7725_006355 [Dissostichus mawsoni]